MTFRRVCLYHGLPFLAVWALYLAGFWPGILTEDSIDQWSQLLSLKLTPYHPPAHTLTNWLITRLWLSPAPVAIAQMIAQALALCGVLWTCDRWGAPAWLRWLTAIWLTLMPATGFLAITLWKDIPYTIAHLVLVTLSFGLVRSEDQAFRRWGFGAALVVTLVAMAVYRHNGLPVVAAYVALLLIVSSGAARRRTLAVAVCTALGIVGVHQAIDAAFHPGPITAALRYQTPLHHVAAIVAADEPLDAADRALLERLMPIATWKSRYYCQRMLPLITPGGINWDALDREATPFIHLWGRLLWQHPIVILRHQACATALLWYPRAPADFAATRMPDFGRALGLAIEPRSDRLHDWLIWLYERSIHTRARLLVWGPSPHGFLLFACTALVWWRQRQLRAVLPFMPAVIHTLVLFLALPSNEFRLQYPVYLIGILSPLMTAALWRVSAHPHQPS